MANELSKHYEVSIASILDDGRPDMIPTNPGIEVARLIPGGTRLRDQQIKLFRPLKKYLKDRNIDIVFTMGHYPGFLAAPVSPFSKSTFIFCDHGALINQWHDKKTTLMRFIASKASKKVVVLTEKSYNIGLATSERYSQWKTKQKRIDHIVSYCNNVKQKGKLLCEIISRPEVDLLSLYPTLPHLRDYIDNIPESEREEIINAAEISIKYAGYIEREKLTAQKMHRLENIHIRNHFDYEQIQSLSTEARQKLKAINPETLAQASRIPGVSPSDINVLLVLMKR